jgi:hypothetical protein
MEVYIVIQEALSLSSSYFNIIDVFSNEQDVKICVETIKNDIVKALDNHDYDWTDFNYYVKYDNDIPGDLDCNCGCAIFNNFEEYELLKIEKFKLK